VQSAKKSHSKYADMMSGIRTKCGSSNRKGHNTPINMNREDHMNLQNMFNSGFTDEFTSIKSPILRDEVSSSKETQKMRDQIKA
jgi:hypothetical protein